MRHTRLLIPLIGLVAVLIFVQICDHVRQSDQELRDEIARGTLGRNAYAILDAKVPQVVYDRVPQRVALEDYVRRTHLSLKVDWEILQAQGIDPEAPLSVRLENVKVSKGLSVLLDDLASRPHQLGYTIADDGTVEVVPDRIAAERAVVDVYDISDLISGAPLQIPQEPNAPKTRDELIEDVTTLIKDVVAPDSWETSGGMVGRVSYFHGRLVITQTLEGHRLTAILIEEMQQIRPRPERRRVAMRLLSDEGGNR